MSRVTSAAASASSDALASADQTLASAADVAGGTAAHARAMVSRIGDQASDGTAGLIATLRETFADLLERQPLALGVLGLAIGAGVAAALPPIAAEQALTDAFGDLKGSVRDGLGSAFSRATAEARAQGLTIEAASNAVSSVGNKISDVAHGAVTDARATPV